MSDSSSYSNSHGLATYPNPSIDPREKGYDFIIQYCKAAYHDAKGYMIGGGLNLGNYQFEEIDLYCMGQQPVDKYKKLSSPGQPTDPSWRAVDWTVPAFMCKYIEIAVSLLHQKQYDFGASAIDPLAKSEEDAYFNKMKVKIFMREEAQKAGSDLADSPLLAPQPGEPEDLEQLTMQKDYGYKHIMAEEAEHAIALLYSQNNIDELRTQLERSLYRYGIGAMTQWIDENGMCKQRVIDMNYFGSSYFEKPDGSDMIHWYEVVPTYVADLAPYYTKEQLDEICKKSLNKNGNPEAYMPFNGGFNREWNRFKVMVMQIKFLSWNDTVYKEEKDNRQNTRFRKSSYKNKEFLSVNRTGNLEEQNEADTSKADDFFKPLEETGEHGAATPKYINSTRKVSYKASWVIGTDYMHDWGLRENQNRKLSSWWDTDLDIQLYAWNFSKMRFTGIAQRLIPLEDRACMAWFNLQNLSNKLIPYLINIDFNAVEAVNFGKAGQKAKPSEIIDFIFSNFVVPYRSTDLLSRNPNYKPVSIEGTGQLQAFGHLYDELAHTLDMMRQVSGLNEATDASTVNAKNLNSTNEVMIQSTNNTIYPIFSAVKSILLRTADAGVQKVQIAVQLGKVEGYAKALGSNAIQFFRINPNISLHELGIEIYDAPTDAQREALWQDASIKESQGLLTIGDKAFIMTVRNLKQAYHILDYKIRKRKEEAHAQQMQLVQQQTDGNKQTAEITAQLQQQTAEILHQFKMEEINAQGQWNFVTEQFKKQSDQVEAGIQADSKIEANQVMAQAKIISQQIASESSQTTKQIDATSHLLGKQIDAQGAKEKQEIANKKKPATSKSK